MKKILVFMPFFLCANLFAMDVNKNAVKKSGDTMTANLTVSNVSKVLIDVSDSDAKIKFSDGGGTLDRVLLRSISTGNIYMGDIDDNTNGIVLRTSGADRLTITPTGDVSISGSLFGIATSSTIAASASPGTAGDIRWDASYIYVCTSANTWKRAALSAW